MIKTKFLLFKEKYEKYFPAAFFILGLIFDIVTADRIDYLWTLLPQAGYLVVITTLITFEMLEQNGKLLIPLRVQKLWQYKEEIIHFLFGSLLSAFAIFYFKSSSFLSSFLFFIVICSLLVLNEVPRFQKLGLTLRYALLTLCLVSYFAYVFPILLGFIGIVPFLLAIFGAAGCMGLLYWFFRKRIENHQTLQNQIVRPSAAVLGVFLLLYIIQAIPPVPLAVNFQGIYHNIEKKEGAYFLFHQRPWWKFWETGDQTFYARPGDRIYYFANIFSPTSFKDKIQVRWLYKDKRSGWTKSDAIPISIIGGRDEGFRGVTFKENYQPGDWRVQLETTDGREIGRIYFAIKNDDEREIREYNIDVR